MLERLIKTFYLAIVRDTDIEAFVEVCFSAMRTYGYDPYKAMHETIKEISSRQQDPAQKERWDAKQFVAGEKWQKWREQPADSLYKADYSKAK